MEEKTVNPEKEEKRISAEKDPKGNTPKIETETEIEKKSETDAGPAIKSREELEAEVEAERSGRSETKADPETKVDLEKETKIEPETDANVESNTGGQSETEMRSEPDETEEPNSSERSGKPHKPVKRRKRSTRRKRRNMIIGLIILVLAAVAVLINLPYFNVENISVIGNKRVEDAEIKRLSEMEDEKSLYGLNSILAAQKIKVNPYIDSVKVKRTYPSTIAIIVSEKEPAAQLATPKKKDKKRKYVAVDSEGTVLEISEKKLDMTYIKEVDVTEAKLREKIRVKDEASYEKAMELIATAAENDMYFMRITINGSWVDSCIYGDLYCKGRYRNIENALKKGTLRTVVFRLYQQNVNKGTINVADNDYCSFTDKT